MDCQSVPCVTKYGSALEETGTAWPTVAATISQRLFPADLKRDIADGLVLDGVCAAVESHGSALVHAGPDEHTIIEFGGLPPLAHVDVALRDDLRGGAVKTLRSFCRGGFQAPLGVLWN